MTELITPCNTHCDIMQRTMQYTATHCNTLQHTVTHCNTLQHTLQLIATQSKLDDMTGLITKAGAVAGCATVGILLIRFALAFVNKACCKEVRLCCTVCVAVCVACVLRVCCSVCCSACCSACCSVLLCVAVFCSVLQCVMS